MSERNPAAGDLLVASVLLADGVFNSSVVLILDFDSDGALGVIVNEISQLPLDAVLPDWADAVSEPKMLFHGGPVSPNGAICLASVKAEGRSRQGGGRSSTPSACSTSIPRSRLWQGPIGTCGFSRAIPGGQPANCRPRSPRACGTSFGPSTPMFSAAVHLPCGGPSCAGSTASSRTSRRGSTIPSSTEAERILVLVRSRSRALRNCIG